MPNETTGLYQHGGNSWANGPRVEGYDGQSQTRYPCGCKTAGYGDSSSPSRIIYCATHSQAFALRDALRNMINSATLLTKQSKDAKDKAVALMLTLEAVPWNDPAMASADEKTTPPDSLGAAPCSLLVDCTEASTE